MKLIFVLLGLIFLIVSCKKEEESTGIKAEFSLGDTLLKTFENIEIVNHSDSNAAGYRWDFGDGSFSSERTPDHFYENPGEYVLKLITIDKSGNSDSTFKLLRVGERYVNEIIINSLSEHKWYPDYGNWDEESVNDEEAPDLYLSISEDSEFVLFESETMYNLDFKSLPLNIAIPDIRIHSFKNIGIGSTGIYLNDRDGLSSETMASNLMSGVSASNDIYNKANHTGEFTIGFFCTYTIKYKIK